MRTKRTDPDAEERRDGTSDRPSARDWHSRSSFYGESTPVRGAVAPPEVPSTHREAGTMPNGVGSPPVP